MSFHKSRSFKVLIFILTSLLVSRSGSAQWSTNVSTADELTAAFAQAFNNSVADAGAINTINLMGNINAGNQMIVNANVNIMGNGYMIDMNNFDRAFFIAGGNVSISNLTIQNGSAKGGAGLAAGGGGAGLGGAIFLGNGTYYGGADPLTGIAPLVARGISVPNMTLNGVSFLGNNATGGAANVSGLTGGGGGGMGGWGGNALGYSTSPGSGGGGFGNGATGSGVSQPSAGAGSMINVIVSANASSSGGTGGTGDDGNGSVGGVDGGGGGIGGVGGESVFSNQGSGGGGGVGGGRGYYANGDNPSGGGNGGFGGGGGAGAGSAGGGGNGGFGGGGGSSPTFYGGTGGFGGGGGGYTGSYGPGPGGFGASRGTSISMNSDGGGGGGLGAGGAIFVMTGANLTISGGNFVANAVSGGQAYFNGSAYGADLFLGADVTFNVSSNLTVNSLGGAGNTSDPNIVNNYGVNYANDPNAQGGIIKTGGGVLTMTGSNYYTGTTVIHQGTVGLGAGALEQGTSQVIVGQNSGDNATLALGRSSTLNIFSGSNPAVVVGQSTGSTGTVIIGSGTGSSGAFVGANQFQGGAGGGSVVFRQQDAAESNGSSIYPFYTALTGNLQVVQDGPGTTLLQPLAAYGPNSFTGGVEVDQGTLQIGTNTALPSGNAITLNGGTLRIGANLSQTMGAWTLNNTSTLDFGSYAASLTFSSFSINGTLAIWNWNPVADSIAITGASDDYYPAITFYSDSGTSELGTGAIVSGQLQAVPEPSTWALLGLGVLVLGAIAGRNRSLS